MHADLSFVSAALETGVSGSVWKQPAATELVTALHEVNSGRGFSTSCPMNGKTCTYHLRRLGFLPCVRIHSALVPKLHCNWTETRCEMSTLLIVLLVLFLLGGGGWGYSRWRG